MSSVSINESELRKKLQDIHDDERVTFDWESVLILIERILILVTSETDVTQNGRDTDSYNIPYTLRSLLQKISCVFTCKCSGRDTDAFTMEILKLLKSFEWEAKIAIVLASFVVEYAQFSDVVNLYKTKPVWELVATLKQLTFDIDENLDEIKSSFKTIVEVSIKATRVIAKFSMLPSKYISNDVDTLHDALVQIPIAGYSVIRVIVACVASLTRILGQTEISPYAETWNLDYFEQNIITTQKELEKQYELCHSYVEKKKETKYMEKLRLKFHKTAVYNNNRKILQLVFNSKDGVLPLAFGSDETKEVRVEDLKEKTVLLLISNLDISRDEISNLSKCYNESRNSLKGNYEIVWFPIGVEEVDKKYEELKLVMPWYKLQKPSSVKRGMVKYVREEWKYSKKTILVALDPLGKVGHLNALHMLLTWGNVAHPFTQMRESEIWSRQKWGLDLVVAGNSKDLRISKWIEDKKKIIILYGGNDSDWIQKFVTQAKRVEGLTGIEVGMMYIGTKKSEEVDGILTGKSLRWESESTTYFWKRIESMVYSDGAGVATAKESILVELRKMQRAGQNQKEWVLISHVEGTTAVGEGTVILQALEKFDDWKNQLQHKNFVAALNDHLSGLPTTLAAHVCKCNECARVMI